VYRSDLFDKHFTRDNENSVPEPDINLKQSGNDVPIGGLGHDFSYIQIGTSSSPATFTIKNLGTDDLNITNILLTADDPDFTVDLSSTVFTIPPSGITTFYVTFTPQGYGRYRNLVINSNDPNVSLYNLRLEGDLE